MIFNYKKVEKQHYPTKTTPTIITIPKMNFIAIRGCGDPNIADGQYQNALKLLYPIAYTLKMSYKSDYQINGFFEYVVPPLEGFWWQEDIKGVDLNNKDSFKWISMLRLPEFVSKDDFNWAIEVTSKKKKIDFSSIEFLEYEEGLCVQCLHLGPFEREQVTVDKMHQFMNENGYELDINDSRFHHEIYLSDPRKSTPDKFKTIIRHPIRKDEAK